MTKDVEKFFKENLDMYPHLKKIRDRLWSDDGKSRVTVMIGAGFSLNAKKIEDSFNGMALWDDIKNELTKSLSHKGNLDNVDVLDIGQMYVKEYGRTHLDEALKNAIPDNNYEPDKLHFDLLRLPWSDIYTTNYDTLLERSKSHVHERNYQTIYDVSDIPNSVQPRIIKLHGSFPANRPFIFTKSDYNNYPVKFSPFVNMVQQSIMETTFVLIGFSGDDPNFSNWTSWVSDNLGEHMPKIYMLGYNQKHREVELEKKGLTLIDFTELYSKESNPFNHMYTEVFSFLMNESKEKKNEWPHRDYNKSIETFIYNRKTYPGWVLLPDRIRRSHAINLHILSNDYFNSLDNNINREQINLINEFLWCFGIFSIPLDFNKQQVLEKIIEELLPLEDPNIKLNDIVLVLLREARLDLDEDKFNKYSIIFKDCNLNSEEKHFLQYETILYLLSLNKISDVLIQLRHWLINNNDYEWNIKKAIIYSNIDQMEVAENLLELSLVKIKKLLTIENENYRLLSLESVILHNLERITNKRGYYSKRLREINSHNCNSNSELEQTWLSVTEYIYDLGNKETPGFDPRTKKTSSKLGDYMRQEILDSYAALILQEKFGLYFIRARLEIAHKNISVTLPNFSLIKQIYYAKSKNIEDIFTRQFVYYLQSPQLKIIESILSNAILEPSPLVPFEHAIEILSRVYFAFSPEKQNIFDQMVLEIIENKKIYIRTEIPLFAKLFQRITFSKTYQQRTTFFEQLLMAMDNQFIENSSNNFFDPFLEILSLNDVAPIKLEIKEEIKLNLLDNVNKESALIRLVFLYQTNNLTTEQEQLLALNIKSLQPSRSFGISNFLFQSTFEFIVDSINLKQQTSPFQIIQNYIINKEIPKIKNNGVITDGSAFDNYFREFCLIIRETIKKYKEIPIEIYAEWLDKFLHWWDSEKEFLLEADNESIWLFRSPDYLLKLVHYLRHTILKTIPLNHFDNNFKGKLSSLINEIYHKKLYCFIHLLPQAKRLNLDLDLTTNYTDLIWEFTDDTIKHAISAISSYLELIAENHIDEEPAPLINQLFAIVKYGSHDNKLVACDTIHLTIKLHPIIFSKEDCEFLIKFSNKYFYSIIENADLIMSQDEFALLASISTLVTQLIINMNDNVGNELDHWIEFIKNNPLPEIRINSDYFIKTS